MIILCNLTLIQPYPAQICELSFSVAHYCTMPSFRNHMPVLGWNFTFPSSRSIRRITVIAGYRLLVSNRLFCLSGRRLGRRDDASIYSTRRVNLFSGRFAHIRYLPWYCQRVVGVPLKADLAFLARSVPSYEPTQYFNRA